MAKKKEKMETDVLEQETPVTEETVAEETVEQQANPLEQENEELKSKLLRQLAEFDNYKKRTAREKEDLYNFAKADCVEPLLSVVDNFERALETDSTDETFKKGVEMIFSQFYEVLTKLGVTEIEAQGKPFNPELHNAINQVEDENFGENTVCQVFQKGYKLGDKVIRHSMVVVANP